MQPYMFEPTSNEHRHESSESDSSEESDTHSEGQEALSALQNKEW